MNEILIQEINNLIKLFSKGATTISVSKTREMAENWVKNYRDDLFSILDSRSKAVRSLEYLTKSINNQRLLRRKWFKNLKIIKKSLNEFRLNNKKQVLIFDPNKPFTAYRFLKEIFAKTTKEVQILDGYVEEGTLEILSVVPQALPMKLLTNNTYGKFMRELPKFKKEFTQCEVRKSAMVHDRFFIIDDKCFVAGTSLHSLGGNKTSYIFETDKGVGGILKKYFDNIWKNSVIL